jgi:tetratricopeptide (TPR) repeat protein
MSKTVEPPLSSSAAAESNAELDAAKKSLLLIFQKQLGVPDDEVEGMLAAVQRGESVAEYYGYTPEVCNTIELVALAHYRTGRYAQACNVFAWLIDATGGGHASGWRGMGACFQAQKQYALAADAYRRALLFSPEDFLSKVFLGECLCHLGEHQEGLALLQGVLETAPKTDMGAPHILRARAIVKAQSVQPAPGTAVGTTASAASPGAKQEPADTTIDAALAKDTAQSAHDAAMQQVMADPKLKEQLEQLTEAVRNRQTTYKELAGFPDEQMDAGYAVACQFLERGDPLQALQTVGWLMWVDARDGRFYQLAGICVHQMKLWWLADYLYGEALEFGADRAMTLVYRGEVKIMLEEKDEAKKLLTEGIELAQKPPVSQDILTRGRFLLKQLST